MALPKPLRKIVESLPRSVKGVLALMSVILALLLALVLRSRRQLADALARAYGDALTGLPNRAAVDETLRRMAGHASRNESQMAAVLFDIDHFKAINDGHGHAKGDEVLAAVGAAARAGVRSADFVGRYGGEEFLLLMPDTGQKGALKVAEKVQRALQDIDVVGIDGTVTASFGVAAGRGDQDELRNLVEVADEALYRAKEAGRDRIEIAHPTRNVLTAA